VVRRIRARRCMEAPSRPPEPGRILVDMLVGEDYT
jgi:hypothetical protein